MSRFTSLAFRARDVCLRGAMLSSSRFRWLAAALIVLLISVPVGIYGWRYVYNPCEIIDVKEASGILRIQLKTYDQVFQVATTASRTAPDHPVNTLKQILMDTQEVPVPACMRTAKNELINYMGSIILAFDAYRAGQADAKVLDLIKQSDAQYANFRSELRMINECAPFCLP